FCLSATIGSIVDLGGRWVRSLAASHTVPALAFHTYTEEAGLVFSGDTGPNDEFWRQVNGVPNLKYLIIETAFANREQDLAVTAKHLFPIQLGQELGPFGITVNAVAPGFQRTSPDYERQWQSYSPEQQAGLIGRTALRRPGEPADIAHAVMFFASDYAGFITGQTLSVSGSP
ncbi:MAG: SDR family oxidoreductase, partial [Rhodospirillales bacterium]|nr:SDR family oxidoreductase [Rhodospirillales bacterium]